MSGRCPEDFEEQPKFICTPDTDQCIIDHQDLGQWRHPFNLDLNKHQNNSFTEM